MIKGHVEVKGQPSLVDEFAGVSLGDRRLDRRLAKIAAAMEAAPGKSLVEQAVDIASVEATYRFMSNMRVSAEAIFEGHSRSTAERASEHASVLVIHDTTEFRFGGSSERRGLGRLNATKREGFLAHFSICASPDGEPLGTLELFAWSRLDEDKREKGVGSLRAPDRESQRWTDAVQRTSERLFNRTSPIHVMDREGDQFDLFAALYDEQQRFVIRLAHDRRLKKGRGKDGHPMLNEVLSGAPIKLVRDVQLGQRERDRSRNKRGVFPERAQRRACIEVRARRIELYRSHQLSEHLPDCLPLNFVEAREVNAPPDAAPVVWRLVTTEPIDTAKQVEAVIDIYRKRWLVEEFFKAIKTGCQFESHQLEDIHGLLVVLSIESAIAWQLLRLRYISRREPNASGEHLLSEGQRSGSKIPKRREWHRSFRCRYCY